MDISLKEIFLGIIWVASFALLGEIAVVVTPIIDSLPFIWKFIAAVAYSIFNFSVVILLFFLSEETVKRVIEEAKNAIKSTPED